MSGRRQCEWCERTASWAVMGTGYLGVTYRRDTCDIHIGKTERLAFLDGAKNCETVSSYVLATGHRTATPERKSP